MSMVCVCVCLCALQMITLVKGSEPLIGENFQFVGATDNRTASVQISDNEIYITIATSYGMLNTFW